MIDALDLNVPDVNELFGPVLSDFNAQIRDLIETSLADKINNELFLKGVGAIGCYTQEVPNLIGNATDQVAKIVPQILTDTKNVIKVVTGLVSSLKAQANAILAEAKQCSGVLLGELLCITPLVSLQLPYVFI